MSQHLDLHLLLPQTRSHLVPRPMSNRRPVVSPSAGRPSALSRVQVQWAPRSPFRGCRHWEEGRGLTQLRALLARQQAQALSRVSVLQQESE